MMNKSMPYLDVRGIGRVVVNFQLLEFTVVRLFWILADTDQEIGEGITGCVNFRSLWFHQPELIEDFQRARVRADGF